MTFELVRMGWPNTAAILALAIMPVVALTARDRPAAAAQLQVEQAEACGNLPDAGRQCIGGRGRAPPTSE